MVSSFRLCRHLISLLPASQAEWAGSWRLTWSPFDKGDGSHRNPVVSRGSRGLVCTESCQVPSPSTALPAGLKKHLELTPFALSGRHWSLLK